MGVTFHKLNLPDPKGTYVYSDVYFVSVHTKMWKSKNDRNNNNNNNNCPDHLRWCKPLHAMEDSCKYQTSPNWAFWNCAPCAGSKIALYSPVHALIHLAHGRAITGDVKPWLLCLPTWRLLSCRERLLRCLAISCREGWTSFDRLVAVTIARWHSNDHRLTTVARMKTTACEVTRENPSVLPVIIATSCCMIGLS